MGWWPSNLNPFAPTRAHQRPYDERVRTRVDAAIDREIPEGWVRVMFKGRYGSHVADVIEREVTYSPSAGGCMSPTCMVPGIHSGGHVYPEEPRTVCEQHGYFKRGCPVCSMVELPVMGGLPPVAPPIAIDFPEPPAGSVAVFLKCDGCRALGPPDILLSGCKGLPDCILGEVRDLLRAVDTLRVFIERTALHLPTHVFTDEAEAAIEVVAAFARDRESTMGLPTDFPEQAAGSEVTYSPSDVYSGPPPEAWK